MKNWHWLIIVAVVSFCAHIWGVDRGNLGMLESVRDIDQKRAETRADVKSWECSIAQAQATRAMENERWAAPRKTLVAEKGKFRLVFERNSNPEFMTWHVTKLVTSQIILDFFSPDHKRAEQPPLARRLFEVDGVQKVYLYQHTITVKVSLAFDYEKVRADAERAILARYGIKIGA